MKPLTEEQLAAVASIERRLHAVARQAELNNLWFFVGDGFDILVKDEERRQVWTDGSPDRSYVVGSADEMPADGGGW